STASGYGPRRQQAHVLKFSTVMGHDFLGRSQRAVGRRNDDASGAPSGSLLPVLDPQSCGSGAHRLTDGRLIDRYRISIFLKLADKTINQLPRRPDARPSFAGKPEGKPVVRQFLVRVWRGAS